MANGARKQKTNIVKEERPPLGDARQGIRTGPKWGGRGEIKADMTVVRLSMGKRDVGEYKLEEGGRKMQINSSEKIRKMGGAIRRKKKNQKEYK